MTFDLEKLVDKYKDKSYIDIIVELTKEVQHLDNLWIKPKLVPTDQRYELEKYRDYAGDLLYFMNTGGTPATIGLNGLRRFLPIISNLVEKGQLTKDVLDRFQ